MFFDNIFQQSDAYRMDQVYFSPTNGLPSESKLATYMSRQNVTTPPTYGMSAGTSGGAGVGGGVGGMSKGSLIGSPISLKKVQVPNQSPEFIPSRINSSPNFYPSYQSAHGGGGSGGSSSGASSLAGSHSSCGNNGIIIGKSNPYATTPIKSRGNPRHPNDSPLTIGSVVAASGCLDSPTNTPRSTPPPSTSTGGGGIGSGVSAAIHQENVGGTTYFYPASATGQANVNVSGNGLGGVGSGVGVGGGVGGVGVGGGLNDNGIGVHDQQSHIEYATHPVHMYSGPSACIVNMKPTTQLSSAFFIADELRDELMHRNELANMLDADGTAGLPDDLEQSYHSLYRLEMPPGLPVLPSSVTYRATKNTTGVKYCIRRLIGTKVQSSNCMKVVDKWKALHHSNVVQMREVFTTKTFNDRSLLFIYDYHPGSQTMLAKYFTPSADSNNGYSDPFHGEARPFSHKSNRTQLGPLLAETEIWSIVMQLTAGLRAIHQANLACRTLDPTKIIITGKRIRYSFLGITDVVERIDTTTNNTPQYQQEDLTSLGKLILALACRSLHSVHDDLIQTNINNVARNYSSDLRNLLYYLLQPSPTVPAMRCVTDLMPMIGARFYTQLDALQNKCDVQDDELSKEMENGRLYRLILKLGTINERPELNLDGSWSETGDRYLLKLYRDYLLHAVTEDGRPWLDHAHIVQSLNKLDAGVLEKVNLTSRDENTILVVTYAELKHCLEQSFAELCSS